MKLHLGCGQRHLEGYINIDHPSAAHTVQEKSMADLHADILSLRYPSERIEEIRLHHVFEHFSRPIACALLASWRSWLQPQGRIHIEVPDLLRTSLSIINPFSSFRRKAASERHLFGSHEAAWATHCEGYTANMMNKTLSWYGYQISHIRRNSWKGTHNFEVIAEKTDRQLSRADFAALTSSYLRNFLVGDDSSESRLLDVWMKIYDDQIDKSWADNE